MKFLLTADWHICGEKPPCRIGDWIDLQRKDVRFVIDYANEHDLPIFHTGDIFDRARCSTEALVMLMGEMARKNRESPFLLLAGNHDLKEHSFENVNSSSIGALYRAGLAYEMQCFRPDGVCAYPFGMDEENNAKCRFMHRLVFPDAKSRPVEDCGITAEELLDLYGNKWIFTGDYHHRFHFQKDGRHVVNPGCLNIQKSDMEDYKPHFCVVDTIEETVEWVEIPVDHQTISTEYNVRKKEQSGRFDAFVERINKTASGVSLSFWDNLDKAAASCSDRVQKIVNIVKEEVKNVRESK